MIEQIRRFIIYYIRAATIYSIHSPRIYSFISQVLDVSKTYYAFKAIESEREALKINSDTIHVHDLGSGSKSHSQGIRSISSIVRHASSDTSKCRILYNIVKAHKPQNILELGTNLGLGSAYLASGYPNAQVDTVEGDPSLHNIACAMFSRLGLPNINAYNMAFTDFLRKHKTKTYDLVFIDGDHSEEGTVRNFNAVYTGGNSKQIIVIDDISWSSGMMQAWEKIKSQLNNAISIDIYKIGIILVDPKLHSVQHLYYIPWKYKPWNIGLFAPRATN